MAFPAIITVVADVLIVVVGVPLTRLLSKTLKLSPKPIVFADPRREAWHASIVMIPLLAWRASLVTYFYGTGIYNQLPSLSAELGVLFWWAVLNGGSLLIVALAVKTTHQTLASNGITRNYLWKAVALGLATSSILLAADGLSFALGFKFSYYLSHNVGIGFVLYSIVGFSEETVWRGYVQTRLVAYAGVFKGIIATSLVFGILYHFATAYYLEASQMVLMALAYSSLRVFGGILFGYIMMKAQNISASATLHLFFDWTTVLWH